MATYSVNELIYSMNQVLQVSEKLHDLRSAAAPTTDAERDRLYESQRELREIVGYLADTVAPAMRDDDNGDDTLDIAADLLKLIYDSIDVCSKVWSTDDMARAAASSKFEANLVSNALDCLADDAALRAKLADAELRAKLADAERVAPQEKKPAGKKPAGIRRRA